MHEAVQGYLHLPQEHVAKHGGGLVPHGHLQALKPGQVFGGRAKGVDCIGVSDMRGGAVARWRVLLGDGGGAL